VSKQCGNREMSWEEFWQAVSAEGYIAKLTLHDELLIKYLTDLLARISAPPGDSARTILEIGCVYSKNLWLLPQAAGSGTVFLGLDSCTGPTLETGRLNPHLNVHVIVGDLFASPLHEASIDLIISFGLIEHFTDPSKFLEACWSLLRPGGWLVVGYPSFVGLTGLIQRLVNPRAFDRHFSLSAEQMLSRITHSGFNKVEKRTIHTNCSTPRISPSVDTMVENHQLQDLVQVVSREEESWPVSEYGKPPGQ